MSEMEDLVNLTRKIAWKSGYYRALMSYSWVKNGVDVVGDGTKTLIEAMDYWEESYEDTMLDALGKADD